MTNQQLYEIEEEACNLPFTMLAKNSNIRNIPTFMLIEFSQGSGIELIWLPLIERELEERSLVECTIA